MNLELKKQWVEALRSGNYQQGQYQLRSKDNCFCCLGVLCDIIDDKRWMQEERTVFNVDDGCAPSLHWVYIADGKSAEMPPHDVCFNAEVSLDAFRELAQMNDSYQSFDTIAEFIDKNW